MSDIAFLMLPQVGHLNASFKLARSLKSRGHRIVYLGVPANEEYVRARGFEFHPIFGNLFRQERAGGRRPKPSPHARLRSFLKGGEEGERFAQIVQRIQGEIDRANQQRPFALFVVDSLLPFVALATYRRAIPTILLSTTFPTTRDRSVPPLVTTRSPADSVFSRSLILWSWYKYFFYRFLARTSAALFGSLDMIREVRRLAREAGYPLARIDEEATHVPSLCMPELVLCPKELDFPRPEKTWRRYIEASLDLDRGEELFPWEQLGTDKPLLYCSLGTQSHMASRRQTARFLRTVISTMTLKPDWQLVIAIGAHLRIGDFNPIPPNVVIVNQAPQLELLKRASIMITHGGLNSIKECIYFGVPMIVFPLGKDQPGNAARVRYHGLGVLGKMRKVTIKYLNALIEEVDGNPSFRARAELMGRKMREVEVSGIGVEIVEQFMAGGTDAGHDGRLRAYGGAVQEVRT
jgi:MGT family glycosyltransferase